ncbi:MAG: biotin/lipoyl-containing protein [Fidelibacterota bacterium]
MKFVASVDGNELTFRLHRVNRVVTVELEDSQLTGGAPPGEEIDFVRLSPHSYSVLVGRSSHYLIITEHPEGFRVVLDQQTYEVKITDERTLFLQKLGMDVAATDIRGEVRAPIPGLITSVFVKPGQKIGRGDKVAILEAMKMENEIQTLVSGTVDKVPVSTGQSVEKDALLVSIVKEDHGDR